jgi:hypothetical protein
MVAGSVGRGMGGPRKLQQNRYPNPGEFPGGDPSVALNCGSVFAHMNDI